MEGEEELAVVVAYFESGGSRSKGIGKHFKAVTQAVLLFGSETWIITPRVERALSSFQHRVAQRFPGRHPRRRGGWYFGVPIIGGINGGSRLLGYQNIHHEDA